MPRLPLFFIIAAAFCLLVGVCLGVLMGIRHDFHLAPVHAHLNLLGWTSLALMGLTFRAYPQLHANPVPAAALAIATSLVWLAGVAMFLARLVLLAAARSPRRHPALLPAE
jgi:hypothetical protein